MFDFSPWIGAVLEQPGQPSTEFCSWRLIACCGAPDLYLAGKLWSVVVDAPWRVEQPSDDVVEVWGWEGHPAAILRRSGSGMS